jgi:hypothetical protein
MDRDPFPHMEPLTAGERIWLWLFFCASAGITVLGIWKLLELLGESASNALIAATVIVAVLIGSGAISPKARTERADD